MAFSMPTGFHAGLEQAYGLPVGALEKLGGECAAALVMALGVGEPWAADAMKRLEIQIADERSSLP